jgi:HPt (histidine-containing phosphotransfer) domain-containing protein
MLETAAGVPVDVGKLVQLHELLGDAFAPLVASFISNAALYVSQIEAAVGALDPAQAAAIAHKLKSSAAQLGLPDLAKAAERVEKLDSAEHLPALKAAQRSLCEALRAAAEAVSKGEALR